MRDKLPTASIIN